LANKLSEKEQELLRWLVNFPENLMTIARFGSRYRINSQWVEEVPDSLRPVFLKSLERKELLTLHIEDPLPTSFLTEFGGLSPLTLLWEIAIRADARELVANDFQETAVSSESLSVGIEASQELRILLNAMDKRFSEGEIRNMILGWIDYENLSGQIR